MTGPQGEGRTRRQEDAESSAKVGGDGGEGTRNQSCQASPPSASTRSASSPLLLSVRAAAGTPALREDFPLKNLLHNREMDLGCAFPSLLGCRLQFGGGQPCFEEDLLRRAEAGKGSGYLFPHPTLPPASGPRPRDSLLCPLLRTCQEGSADSATETCEGKNRKAPAPAPPSFPQLLVKGNCPP